MEILVKRVEYIYAKRLQLGAGCKFTIMNSLMMWINLVCHAIRTRCMEVLPKITRTAFMFMVDMFITKPIDGMPCFKRYFLKLSIIQGCHAAFILGFGFSVLAIVLNEMCPEPITRARINMYYADLILSSTIIIVDFIFLYSFVGGEAKISLLSFYVFLVASAFHLLIFFFAQTPYETNKIRLVHGICVAIFLYIACININFIKKDTFVRKLRRDQLDGLEMWVNWDIEDMFEIESVRGCSYLVHLVVDHPLHRQNRGEAARLNKIYLLR